MVGIATIPNALPVPVLPDVSAETHLITGAIALALVALIVLLVGHQAELIPMPVIGAGAGDRSRADQRSTQGHRARLRTAPLRRSP